ncbi:uncharacterized protein EDB93DRAFT_454307 [Suillus bovinus]|uniref:uncharacterized protein n=1 Tax=Suillus bovinus TaxID=48563 RepID=UPI001B85CCCE|nr:uncharacterized protein EDB93DRAFT_454307 [Suillus bovinus]KAG2146883.1 hypothetical protein EDB93DRAFT_454307 [Suillus bovinus]
MGKRERLGARKDQKSEGKDPDGCPRQAGHCAAWTDFPALSGFKQPTDTTQICIQFVDFTQTSQIPHFLKKWASVGSFNFKLIPKNATKTFCNLRFLLTRALDTTTLDTSVISHWFQHSRTTCTIYIYSFRSVPMSVIGFTSYLSIPAGIFTYYVPSNILHSLNDLHLALHDSACIL